MKKSAPDNETKCGNAVGKQLMHVNIACVKVPWIVQNYDCEYRRDRDSQGNQSVLIVTNCRNGDFLDRQVNNSILHQDNKIEILGKLFQLFRDVLMVAVPMWYDTV